MSNYIPSGTAEILRAAQKDKILCESLEKQLKNIILKTFGHIVWLRYRQHIHISSTFLYYCFTTLWGHQTLGEEYTNILQVDSSLRRLPGFWKRLLMVTTNVAGYSVLEYLLNKLKRKIQNNVFLHEDFRQRLLRLISITKAILPFLLQLHLIIFYWKGAFHNVAKRFWGIRYIRTKPWINENTPVYGFKILAIISLLNVSVSGIYAIYKWYYTANTSQSARRVRKEVKMAECDKCSLCLEPRIDTSSTMCGHLFCWYCIHEWLQTSDRCPICRDFVQPSKIIPLQNYY